MCVFACKYIVTAKLLAFDEPKVKTKRSRSECLDMHLLTFINVQLALMAEGLFHCFVELVRQSVTRMCLLVKEETRRCVNPGFVYVTREGLKQTLCLAADFMEGKAIVCLCHLLNPPQVHRLFSVPRTALGHSYCYKW